MDAFFFFWLAVCAIFVVIQYTGKWPNHRGVPREVRKEIQHALSLDDGDFLRLHFEQRTGAIRYAAHLRNRPQDYRSALRHVGYVYVAKASVRSTWRPSIATVWVMHDPLIVEYLAKFHRAAHSSIYKVGYTTKSPARRIEQLNREPDKWHSTIYQPFEFLLTAWWKVDHCYELEQAVHERLKDSRVAGEIFFESLEKICQLIEEVASSTEQVRVIQRSSIEIVESKTSMGQHA